MFYFLFKNKLETFITNPHFFAEIILFINENLKKKKKLIVALRMKYKQISKYFENKQCDRLP